MKPGRITREGSQNNNPLVGSTQSLYLPEELIQADGWEWHSISMNNPCLTFYVHINYSPEQLVGMLALHHFMNDEP